jgi:hypothetical protein
MNALSRCGDSIAKTRLRARFSPILGKAYRRARQATAHRLPQVLRRFARLFVTGWLGWLRWTAQPVFPSIDVNPLRRWTD